MAVKKLSELTVAELKHELKKRKLEIVGDKATLLARLKKSLVEDAGKSKTPQNKADDQNKKTPIKTESTSQESKDVLKPQTEELNSSKQLDTSYSGMDTSDTSQNTSVSVRNEIINENVEQTQDSSGLIAEKQDEPEKIASGPTGLDAKKEVDDKSLNVESTLKSSVVQSNLDKKVPIDIVKETKNQPKAEGKSEIRLENVTTVDDKKKVLTPVDDKKKVVMPVDEKINNTIPFLNDNPITESTQNPDFDKKEVTKIDNSTSVTEKATTVVSTFVTNISQPADGTSVNKKEEDKKDTSGLPTTLWISGLVGVIKASDLKQAFGKFGKVLSAKIVTSAKNPGSKCFGLITMHTHEDANMCIDNYHNKVLLGSTVTVEFDTKRKVTKPAQQTGEETDDKKSEKKENIVVKLVKKTPEKEDEGKEQPPLKVPKLDILTTSTPIGANKPVSLTNITPIAKSIPTKPATTTSSVDTAVAAKPVDNVKKENQQKPPGDVKQTQLQDNVTTSVWLSGLPSSVKAADLKTLCLVIGKVLAAKVVASAKSTTFFGLVTMSTKEDADGCVKKLDKSLYEGKTITCELAPYNNVTPELLKYFSKAKNQPPQQPGDKTSNSSSKEDCKKTDVKKADDTKKAEDEKKAGIEQNKKDDKDGNKDKVTKSTINSSNNANAGGKSNQNSGANRNKNNNSPRNRNIRNTGNNNNNIRRNNYNSNRGHNNRNIPSLLESNPYEIARLNSLASPPNLFSNANFAADSMRNYGGRIDRIRLEQEKLEAERANALLFQEQQRLQQQQMMPTFRGDGWSQPPSRMKRTYEGDDDLYWGPPPHQSAPKRYAPTSLVQPSYADDRMGPGPQNYW